MIRAESMRHLDHGVDVLDAVHHMLDDLLRGQHLERVILFLLAPGGLVYVHIHRKIVVPAGHITRVVLVETLIIGIHLFFFARST